MKIKDDFEIVEVAGEYMAVPVGKMALSFHGVIALSEPAAYLLENLKSHKTIEEIVKLIIDEYDVDFPTAETDVNIAMLEMISMGLIEE